MFKTSLLSRRHFLCLSASGLGGAIILKGQKNSPLNQIHDNPKRNFKVVGQASLKQRASAKGLIYGAAAAQYYLKTDKKLADSYVQQCSIIVSDVDLKWDVLRPDPNRFDFTKGDWLANFARTHGMLFRGHTLVWERQLPKWFNEVVNRQNAERFLVEHISTVVKHYAGQLHSWDVVNEAVTVGDNGYSKHPGGLSNSPWLRFLGERYIELAFRTAAAADPHTMLVYNDRRLDYDTPRDNAQRASVLKLLQHLKSQKTPIHALGIQAHLRCDGTRFNATKLRNFLKDVASLGLKILITELDVKDNQLPADITVRDRIVASAYEDYLSVILDEPAVIAVLTWELSDRHTWLSMFPRLDHLPVRPLPLDSKLKPKLAWNAMARAFDHAPKR